MDITIDTSQVVALTDLWAKAPDIAREEMLRSAKDIDNLMEGDIRAALPLGAGGRGGGAGLMDSVFHSEQALDDGVIGMVATSRPYAAYIELGTKPHTPPIQPLVDWVNAVIGPVQSSTSKKTGRMTATGPQASAVFAIRAAIAKHGTKPNPVWQTTYNKNLPKIQQKLEAGLERIRARLAGASA